MVRCDLEKKRDDMYKKLRKVYISGLRVEKYSNNRHMIFTCRSDRKVKGMEEN